MSIISFLLKYGIYTYNVGSRLKYFSYTWRLLYIIALVSYMFGIPYFFIFSYINFIYV